MGVEIDPEINKQIHGTECVISTPASKVKVVVIPTDEEYMIASDTKAVLSGKMQQNFIHVEKRRTHCTPFLFSHDSINSLIVIKNTIHKVFSFIINLRLTILYIS